MNNKNITKIKVDIILKGEDAKFFEFLCDLNKKENHFKDVREFIEFLFMTGFTFVRGQFIGSMMADMLNQNFPTIIGQIAPLINVKKLPTAYQEKIQVQNKESNIIFDRAFLNGEPAEYKVADNKQTLSLRVSNVKKKGKWIDIYLLKQNKPLIWEGDIV